MAGDHTLIRHKGTQNESTNAPAKQQSSRKQDNRYRGGKGMPLHPPIIPCGPSKNYCFIRHACFISYAATHLHRERAMPFPQAVRQRTSPCCVRQILRAQCTHYIYLLRFIVFYEKSGTKGTWDSWDKSTKQPPKKLLCDISHPFVSNILWSGV